jgi:AcrR family transcriptional regulator
MAESLESTETAELPDDGAAAKAPRLPQQPRGQKRVEQILDAAEALIGELGLEAVTTNSIAERAGSSMGSLYHFFPGGKDAVVEALGRRYMEHMRALNAQALDVGLARVPLRDVFRGIVMGMADFIAATPAFPAVHDAMIRVHCLPHGKLAEYEDAILDSISRYIQARLPRLPKERLETITKVSFQTVSGSVDLSMRVEGAERQAVLDEIQEVMVNYMEPLERKFGPLPT